MHGILNGRDPDSGYIHRAPQLAALAALHAASQFASLALLAAHPELRERFSPKGCTDATPLASAAADVLDAASELRARICRYANRLGTEILWRP